MLRFRPARAATVLLLQYYYYYYDYYYYYYHHHDDAYYDDEDCYQCSCQICGASFDLEPLVTGIQAAAMSSSALSVVRSLCSRLFAHSCLSSTCVSFYFNTLLPAALLPHDPYASKVQAQRRCMCPLLHIVSVHVVWHLPQTTA